MRVWNRIRGLYKECTILEYIICIVDTDTISSQQCLQSAPNDNSKGEELWRWILCSARLSNFAADFDFTDAEVWFYLDQLESALSRRLLVNVYVYARSNWYLLCLEDTK